MFQRICSVLLKGASVVAISYFFSSATNAQEGHPLKGSWIGEWSGNSDLGEFVLVVMDWDGSAVSGMINPGTDNMGIENVDLNPEDWSVTIESGGYTIEAVIENLELPSRALVGTWRGPGGEGNFEIVRQ
jgi:hypothetical protein